MKNPVLITLVSSMLVFCAMSSEAANHYVRAGATGSNNGIDWTNAYTSLPSTLTRGDTYYIADGNYPRYTFNTPASGGVLITIKKATVGDHGTSTGWSDAFGSGQAILKDQIRFTTNDWAFDGQVGGGPDNWTNGHGFKIVLTGIEPGVLVGDYGFNFRVGNITVSHFEVAGNLNSNGGGSMAQDGVAVTGGNGLTTIRYFYIHDVGRCPFFLGVQNFTAEYGYTGRYTATNAQHSEVISGFDIRGLLTFRYNIVTHSDANSTGGLMFETENGGSVDVYGNVFVRPASDTWGGSNGVIGGWTGGNGEQFLRVRAFNNSFVNISNVTTLGTFPKVYNSTVAQNNLFYTVSSPGGSPVWQTISHNHFISTSPIGTNTSSSSSNPFVNIAGLDFHLTTATPAGVTLAAPYNRDMYGNVRGADGVWDRGAVEFVTGGTVTIPSAPTNLVIQ